MWTKISVCSLHKSLIRLQKILNIAHRLICNTYFICFFASFLSFKATLHRKKMASTRLFSFRISHFVFFGRNSPTGLKATWPCFHFWVNWSLKRVQPFLTNSKSWVSVSIKPEADCSRSVSDRTGLFLLLLTLGVAEQGPGFEENSICYLLIQTHSSPSRLCV